jgi:hypothetical protein
MYAVFSTAGCALAPPFYWAESIHARVVDAETGRPIEGAAVVADWKLYGGGMGHGGHRSSMIVEETLTDANGEFRFGKWGPKLRPYYGVLDTAPWLVVFKTEYQHRFLPNENDSNCIVRHSDWNGKAIDLSRFSGTAAQRIDQLDLVLSISERQPLMLEEILREEAAYRSTSDTGRLLFDHVKSLLKRGSNEKARR